ncbi:MAG: hypothetical protein ABW215_04375 [Kibdelosporangium sp.]
MFDFGVPGYRPQWLNGLRTVTAAHGDRLHALAGRPLTHLWLVWDLGDDTWFADCPVLVDFGGAQIEINNQKFDDLSITWNTVDPGRPMAWPRSEDPYDFERRAERGQPGPGQPEPEWQDRTPPELRGQPLQAAEFVAWAGPKGDMANGAVHVEFTLPGGGFTIFNALDENGIEYSLPAPRTGPATR